MTLPVAIIAVVLVLVGAFALWKTKHKEAGAGLLAAAGALFALLVLDKERKRSGEVAARTDRVKEGRKEAAADAEATEAALSESVEEEASVHSGAAEEQEALSSPSKRQRIEA